MAQNLGKDNKAVVDMSRSGEVGKILEVALPGDK